MVNMEVDQLGIDQILAEAAQEKHALEVHTEVPIEVDAGTLSCDDPNLLDVGALKNKNTRDEALRKAHRDCIQVLFNTINTLPKTMYHNLACATLPASTMRLPREKSCPTAPKLTKWEQYAKEKGIKKKKKQRSKWDEVAGEHVPTYGKLKVQLEKEKNWVLEVPRNAPDYECQFQKAADAKKERQAKNEFQRLRNIARDGKGQTAGVGVMRMDTKDVGQLQKAQHFSRFATASMGKFQPVLKGEKDIKGFAKKAKKAGDQKVFTDLKAEKKKALKIASKLSKPAVNPTTQQLKAATHELAMEDIQKRRDAKNQRRSAAGGRRKSKSGAALASLTKGKQGDKASKRDYAKKHDDKAGNKKGKKENVFKKKMGGKGKGKK